MPITSKNISINDLQLYLEDDIQDDKKTYIFEIDNKNKDGKNLTTKEAYIIKELNILRNVDNFFEKAIENQPSMPKELQDEIDKTLTFISTKEPSLIKSFFNIKHLISSSIGALAAIVAMTFFTVSTTNLAFKGVVSSVDGSKVSLQENADLYFKNTPNSWFIKSDIAFALSHTSKEKKININENVKVKLGDTLFFTLIPLKSKNIDIKIISNNGKENDLYKNLSVKKGVKFESKDYEMGLPTGTDRFQILENGKVILEKEIIVSE